MSAARPSLLRAAGQWAFAAATAPALLGTAAAAGMLDFSASHALLRTWAGWQLDALGLDVHVDDQSGLKGRTGVLFVDLHQQTLLTTVLYPVALPQPMRLIINAEFAALPFIGWVATTQGNAVILRQRPKQATRVLKRVAGRLRDGETFLISIEGRRTADGGLSPYKKGPAALAIDAQCDIVPFMSHGEYAHWPRGEWRVKPGRIDVSIYPPLSTRGLTYADRNDVVAQLRALGEREFEASG